MGLLGVRDNLSGTRQDTAQLQRPHPRGRHALLSSLRMLRRH